MKSAKIVLAVAGLVAAACLDSGRAEDKVLFSFEREEVDKALAGMNERLQKTGFKALEDGGFLFHEVQGYGREVLRPMHCVTEKASAGKYACKVVELAEGHRALISRPAFRWPRLGAMPLHLGSPRANVRLGEILDTTGWFDRIFPRDWSGHELLRVDVFLEKPQAGKLMLEVEDDLVEPPVSLTYDDPPAGKWVTLEMDLTQAAADRKLDLKCMRNMWVRVDFKDAEKQTREMYAAYQLWKQGQKEELEKRLFLAYVDNIRLCRKGAPCPYPILRGTRSAFTMQIPRSYAVEEQHGKLDLPEIVEWPTRIVPADGTMPPAAKPQPPAGPVKLAPPSVIPIRDMILKGCLSDDPKNSEIHHKVRLTCTAAADPARIVVGFWIWTVAHPIRYDAASEVSRGAHAGLAVRTADGGKTWKGLDGTDWPTRLGGNSTKVPPRPTDLGPDVMGMYPFGCGGSFGSPHHSEFVTYPADRVFFVRSVFTGDSWWKSPKYFVSGEARYCHWVLRGDVAPTPSGRIWLIWPGSGRGATHAYCSDDGGATWCGWRGPGFVGTMPSLGGHNRLAPYGGQVAAFGGRLWTWFDGTRWAEPRETGGACWYVVSCGREIFLSDGSGPVRWYDGKTWDNFSVPGRTGKAGVIGTCGWKTAVFVEPDQDGKKLLCWRKKEGGDWQGPQELVSEQTPIIQIAVQRYGPEQFVPVAYMCAASQPAKEAKKGEFGGPYMEPSAYTLHEPWIKVLLVPAE